MYEADGILQYGPGGRAVVWIDQGINDFYRKLIPKYCYPQPQMYPAHITVVRIKKESPKNMDVWGKYEGEVIQYSYDPTIRFDGTYFYLNAYSERIGDIREELGLPRFRFGELGSDKCSYHTSIANVKNQKVLA